MTNHKLSDFDLRYEDMPLKAKWGHRKDLKPVGQLSKKQIDNTISVPKFKRPNVVKIYVTYLSGIITS